MLDIQQLYDIVNSNSTDFVELDWCEETNEFDEARIKLIIRGIEDVQQINRVARLIQDEWEVRFARHDGACYVDLGFGFDCKFPKFSTFINQVFNEEMVYRHKKRQQAENKQRILDEFNKLSAKKNSETNENEQLKKDVENELIAIKSDNKKLSKELEKAKAENEQLRKRIEELETKEESEEEEQYDEKRLKIREAIILLDLLYNVGFSSTYTNISAYARLITKITGYQVESVRAKLKKGVNYDSSYIKNDVKHLAKLSEHINKDISDRLLNLIK